jgi:hypothetical protein
MRAEIAEGLRYVLRHRYLKNIAACTATGNLFAGVTLSIFLLYLARDIGLSPAVIGIVLAAGNTGPLAGAVLANRIANDTGRGADDPLFRHAHGATPAARPARAAGAGTANLLHARRIEFHRGFAAVVYNITQVSLRQALTPERMQGRMNATMRFIVWGTIPLGQMLGGATASMFGTSVALWLGAMGVVFSFIPILLSDVPSIREMPTQREQQESSGTS